MRIISGTLKKHRFTPPKGFTSRPTTDFAKEGLFNVLENQLFLEDLIILDLYAGTGSISFELASRQAGQITSVDKNFKCIRFIKEFTVKHDIAHHITPVKADVKKFITRSSQSYDLIFADPPFSEDMPRLPADRDTSLIDTVMSNQLLYENGVFILEHSKHLNFLEHPNFVNSRKYGHIVFSFFEHIK